MLMSISLDLAGFEEGSVFAPILCRKPEFCTSPPDPPASHGLQVQPVQSAGVPEFSYISFNCSDSNKFMYMPPLYIEKLSSEYVFQVDDKQTNIEDNIILYNTA